MRKELRPEDVTAIQDSREQMPLQLNLTTIVKGLKTGDYSYVGGEDICAIERKSKEDFVGCCGLGRERFMAEMERILLFKTRIVVIEASWADLERGDWVSRIKPASVIGTVHSLIERGITVAMTDNRERAARLVSRAIFFSARNQRREQVAAGESD